MTYQDKVGSEGAAIAGWRGEPPQRGKWRILGCRCLLKYEPNLSGQRKNRIPSFPMSVALFGPLTWWTGYTLVREDRFDGCRSRRVCR